MLRVMTTYIFVLMIHCKLFYIINCIHSKGTAAPSARWSDPAE